MILEAENGEQGSRVPFILRYIYKMECGGEYFFRYVQT